MHRTVFRAYVWMGWMGVACSAIIIIITECHVTNYPHRTRQDSNFMR